MHRHACPSDISIIKLVLLVTNVVAHSFLLKFISSQDTYNIGQAISGIVCSRLLARRHSGTYVYVSAAGVLDVLLYCAMLMVG